ncbi:Gallate 1-beta-glucosyltransferase [Sesamum angolense]|uniref:Gallate 1-beta-glucosyltransferase n=1 Tax=Sesamum angolense TaxID=2727404 RepID=A0AAE1WYF2_9LAMI|nr:Gallate 1-beta-glucosyltransferase [Sesamum angolense]
MDSPVESNASLRNNIHIFMVSFPGQGHVNPLLRLAKRLASFGLFVTLSAPEFAGLSIRKANTITDDEPTRLGTGMIRFEFFDDGWDFNDPNRDDLDSYLAQLERVGRQKVPQMIQKQAEKGRPVSCVVNNPFIPWVSDVAEILGIPSAMLWIQSCASFSAYYHYYNELVPFPSEHEPEIDVQLPYMPLLKHDEVPSFLHPSTTYPFLRRAILGQFKNLSKPFCILMDTFQELEHGIVEHMSNVCRPIKTIGPLFKELKSPNSGDYTSESNAIRADFYAADSCLEWLDSPQSVVYISFGSIVHLKQEQVDEIAHGLLGSEVSFLWVVRPPPKELNVEPHVLPQGFLEKAGDKGKIVKWSPQEQVLAHPSTACFVTHCGWNSSMEALASGVPVGIRLCRGEAEGRIVTRDEVERCFRAASGGPEAAEMKQNALKWKKAAEEAVAEGGSSYRNMRDFVDEVVRIVTDAS